jgi:maleamate amidohydrolase
MTTAVLLIDLQKDNFLREFSDPIQSKNIKAGLVKNINPLLDSARKNGVPIIFASTSLLPDKSNWNLRMKDLNSAFPIKGTEGEGIIDEINTEKNDIFLTKTRYSAFFKTGLDDMLKSMHIASLVICGIHTHACVRTTAVDAFMLDYRVFLPKECIATYDQTQNNSSVNYLSKRISFVLPTQEMIKRIEEKDFDFKFKS